MNIACKSCRQNFEIADDDMKFYEKVSPVFGDKKYLMPAPKLCPDCRQQRRLSFRNERNLYNRACDLCKKPIITIYSPDKKFTIYCRECWWSDKWDSLSYGKDFDFKRRFIRCEYFLTACGHAILGLISPRFWERALPIFYFRASICEPAYRKFLALF